MDQRTMSAPTPFIVGLTGGIGSGKSAVADIFSTLGAAIVDADILAREVVMPGTVGLASVIDHFGNEILQADGMLDRAALRQRVFHDPAERQWLNALLHPLIRQQMQHAIVSASGPYVVLVVPLLIENNMMHLCDRVLVVDCKEENQLSRTGTRDNTDLDTIKAIMATQATRAQRLQIADDIVNNDSDFSALTPQVTQLHQKYQQLAAAKHA